MDAVGALADERVDGAPHVFAFAGDLVHAEHVLGEFRDRPGFDVFGGNGWPLPEDILGVLQGVEGAVPGVWLDGDAWSDEWQAAE